MYFNNMVKSIVALKKENEELQEAINFLRMENFDYALKCNRIANIISNIKTITQDNPRKLSDASENLFSILQTYGNTAATAINRSENINSHTIVQNKTTGKVEDVSVGSKKAQVVNPHSINGSVLFIPTINLTRISDMQIQSISNDRNSDHTIENKSENSTLNGFNPDSEVEPSTSTMQEHTENQLSNLEDVSDATQKSPAHSTVLSGTFQEVKIFLNQISPKRRNEETRKTNPKRQRTKYSKKANDKSYS